MKVQYCKSQNRFLLRELRIIWWVQVISLSLGTLFLFLFAKEIIPDYPEWDNIHLLCGASGIGCFVVFVVSMLWGGYKLMDLNFMPRIFQFYAVSIWLFPMLFIVLANILASTSVSLNENVLLLLYVVFVIYNNVFLFVICRWLGKKLEKFQGK